MSQDNNKSPRRAWITGAGKGIGRCLAQRLAADGWIVAVSARTASDLESLAVEMPARIKAIPLDVTDEAACAVAVEAVEARIGPLDLVVLNAGTYRRVSAATFTVADYRQVVEANLMGTVNCLAAIMPRMVARRTGHLAVVASLTGYVGLPSSAAYGATKAALINMCEALQPELAVHGVRISVINPGFVDTPLTQKNDFPMPFLMPVEAAVDRIVQGLESQAFEIAFPWRMKVLMRLLASLPDPLRLAITRRMVR